MVDIYKDGVGLWYELSGEGPPLVLIGGFALQDRQWEFCVDALRKSHTVINWCHRGAGRSDWTLVERPSLEDYVEDLRIILDHAGIDKVALWGTSTGAPISIRFAAKYPERTSALITYPWLKADDDWRGILDTAFLTAKYFGVPAMSRLFAGAVIPEDLLYEREGTDYERWAKQVYADYVNPETLRLMLDAYSEIDLTGDVKRLQCPTMLLMGNDSAQNKKAEMETVGYDHLMATFLALKDDVEIGAIEHAGSTYCMITRPDDCARVATDFLARNPA
jgi:pimeloyl-ACP methyl ester carboxylesterase